MANKRVWYPYSSGTRKRRQVDQDPLEFEEDRFEEDPFAFRPSQRKRRRVERSTNETRDRIDSATEDDTTENDDTSLPRPLPRDDASTGLPRPLPRDDRDDRDDAFDMSDLMTSLTAEEIPDDPNLNDNVQFYRGKLKSRGAQNSVYIKNMLKWQGDYDKLEASHDYIQWLFPNPQPSTYNTQAQPLQRHEMLTIQNDDRMRQYLYVAFTMMLDFYGFKLLPGNRQVVRKDNFRRRFRNLKFHQHNAFRITRIIRALGYLGWRHLQKPFVERLVFECTQGLLGQYMSECRHYWIPAVVDVAERQALATELGRF